MTQRVLAKFDVLKRYEKKRLRKYDMVECRNLGKIQLNPYVRTPLTFDFKMGYESSRPVKPAVSATPSYHRVIQKSQSTAQQGQRPESTHVTRMNHSGKPAMRPFSAPTYLKSKPTDQRGNHQALDGGFMILKLNPKLKPAHSAMAVQKKRVPEPQITSYFTAEISSEDQLTMATVEKGDYLSTEKSSVTDVGRDQSLQDLEQKRKVKFCPNGNLSDALNGSLLKDNLTNEGERTEETFIQSEDTLLKKKKLPVPLCIEDEIEKPNAKVIRAGSPKAKCQIPVKMSESFPIFTHNGGYMENYVLNRWLALYGNKAFYDMNKRGEVCMHLNPVLQNNYNESIAIIGSKQPPPPNLTIKRTKKPTFSGKPKRLTIQILSVEKARCDVCLSSKKETQFVQKTGASVTRTTNSNTVTERNITWSMPTCSKDELMIRGVNLKSAEYPDTSSSSLISRMKSQLPLNSVEDVRRKGRMIFVDYIPISKPIPIHRPGDEVSPIYDPTKTKPSETNTSFMCHQDMFDQKPFQDENRLADIEIIAMECKALVQEGRKGSSSRLTSSASLKGFPRGISYSLVSQKPGNMATHSEEQYITPTHSAVISIPTAEFDTTESHRDQSMQDFNDTL